MFRVPIYDLLFGRNRGLPEPLSDSESIRINDVQDCADSGLSVCVSVFCQVYDLSSAAESENSTPGCVLTDGVCLTAGGPSCGVHGKCLGEWGSFSCDCHPGYSGHKCDKALPEWSFEKDSVLRYQLRGGESPRKTLAHFLLRTRSSMGSLLSMASRDANEFIILEVRDTHECNNIWFKSIQIQMSKYIWKCFKAVMLCHLLVSQIVDGYLTVRANLGDGAHSLKLTGHRVNLGQWVFVSLHRYDNIFTLRLEQGGGSREVTGVLGQKKEIVVHPTSVFLGNSATPNTQGDFQGGISLPFLPHSRNSNLWVCLFCFSLTPNESEFVCIVCFYYLCFWRLILYLHNSVECLILIG